MLNLDQMITWRRHLHKYPELSRQEFETSQYIYEQLSVLPNVRLSRPTETSVVAEIGQGHRTILFRADIDAIAGTEMNDVDYKSTHEGIMHTCGHDAHAAMMMGVVTELAQNADKLHGTVRCVFQHSEEKKPSGAEELVNAGICDGVECAFGLHIAPCLPTGAVLIPVGPATTASTRFVLNIKGRGAHTATPEASIDPIYVGAKVVDAVQSIISRNVAPSEAAVISFGEFKSGTASSVIPETAYLTGSMRSFRREFTDFLEERFRQVVENTCRAYGAKVDIELTKGLPPIFNTPEMCRIVEKAALRVNDRDKVVYGSTPPNGGDDFAYYTQAVPGCYFQLGAGEAKDGYEYMNHSPYFRVDERAFLSGANTFVNIAYELLG